MANNPPRILYDLGLSHKSFGFSGIPQDARLLFRTLSDIPEISIAGLMKPRLQRFPYGRLSDIGVQAEFLADGLGDKFFDADLIERALQAIPAISRAYRLLIRAGFREFTPKRIHSELKDIIWRESLGLTLNPEDKSIFDNVDFYATSLGNDRSTASAIYGLPRPRIDTKDFDFYLTQDSQTIQVSRSTIQIVRYHDGLPVLAADTTPSGQTRLHMKNLELANPNAVYVCNTPSAQNDLAVLNPQLAESSRVIPYTLPEMSKYENNLEQALENIFSARRSEFSKKLKQGEPANKFRAPKKYILSLATIEPRKNYGLLIEAWLRMKSEYSLDYDLVISGKPGWKTENTLNSMAPHIMRGDLHHIESVSQAELSALYSGASLFVFPSFAEGFGLPPIEAMSCGTPTIMSDIPAHRYSGGSGAEYFSPYDVEALTSLMSRILTNRKRQESLSDAGFENAKRFTDAENAPRWKELFHELRGTNR